MKYLALAHAGAKNLVAARQLTKWCAYALVLLAPGSFVVLPLLWLIRVSISRPAERQ